MCAVDASLTDCSNIQDVMVSVTVIYCHLGRDWEVAQCAHIIKVTRWRIIMREWQEYRTNAGPTCIVRIDSKVVCWWVCQRHLMGFVLVGMAYEKIASLYDFGVEFLPTCLPSILFLMWSLLVVQTVNLLRKKCQTSHHDHAVGFWMQFLSRSSGYLLLYLLNKFA